MTVLQKRDARGFESGSFRKFVVGAALAVVGVAAALGLTQVIDQEAAVETGLTTVERNAVAAAQAERAESIHPVDRMMIERYQQAANSSLVLGGYETQTGPR